MTALPGGLLGAVGKAEMEKHILVSLPSLVGIAWGRPVSWRHHLEYCFLFLPGNLIIAVFHFELLNISFKNIQNSKRRKEKKRERGGEERRETVLSIHPFSG